MSEQVDFDLDRATDEAWQQFEERLADVLSVIDPGGELRIGTMSTTADPAPFLYFRCLDADRGDERVLHAEASSNAVLGDTFQLSPVQLQAMVDLGWTEPSAVGERASANFTHEHSQDDSAEVAALSVRTLRDVFGVQHPVFLAPDQLAEVLQPGPAAVEEPDIDLEQVTAVMPRSAGHLADLVLADLTRMFGHEPFRDSEGDIAVRVGSTVVFVRVTPDAREVLVFSVLVHDVEGRSRAMELLNDLNTESRFGRFALHRDKVLCSMSLLAEPFVPLQMRTAFRIMSEIADGIDDDLAHRLRGRTTFDADEE